MQAGTTCFEALQEELRLALSCGICLDCEREMFDHVCAAAPLRTPAKRVSTAA